MGRDCGSWACVVWRRLRGDLNSHLYLKGGCQTAFSGAHEQDEERWP